MNGRLVPRRELSASLEEAMFSLLQTQFVADSWDRFKRDLENKDWVILIRDGSSLVGFSTLRLYDACYEGESFSVIYSGDTVVDPSAGINSSLSRTWIASVNHLRRSHARGKLYWLLLSSGYRTYRFLPVYFHRFHPRHDEPTPEITRRLMDFLARRQFGPLYHGDEGIVRFSVPQILKPELRGIPKHRLQDPHIEFFARSNPGHEAGDELVCLTELSEANLTPAGRRYWAAGFPD